MKKTIIVVALTALAAILTTVSCTKQEMRLSPSPAVNKQIEVRSYSAGGGTQLPTKSAIFGSIMPTDRDIVLSAYYNSPDGDADKYYFSNYTFSYSSERQTWTSAEEPVYWPLQGTLDFLAYSSEDAQLSAEWNADNCSDEVALGNFKESQSLSDDLLYAKANGQSYSASGVPMEFRHAKSLIVFTAKASAPDAVNITKIEINGLEQIDNAKTQLTVYNNGAEPATAEWNKSYKAAEDVVVPGIDNISYSVPVKAMDVTKKSSYLGIGGQGIMVPEQEMKSFTVYFEQKGSSGIVVEEAFTYNCQIGEADDAEWQMGKRYIYELNFKVDEIEVSPVVVPWDESAEGTTTVDIPEAASFKATTTTAGEEFSLPTMTLTDGTKVIIDWADGTTPDEYIYVETKASPIEVGEDGVLDASHTYAAAGTYPVKIFVSEDGHVDMGEVDKSIYDLIVVKNPERFSVECIDPEGNIHFEDPLFKAYCVENFDQDGDGEVSFKEAEGVTEMEFDSNGMDNLVGIEHFTNLMILKCRLDYYDRREDEQGNRHYFDEEGKELFGLNNLDLSHNIALMGLDCYDNQLTTLDLSNNTALTMLACGGNPFKTLDVSQYTNLELLSCAGCQLTELDVTLNVKLNFFQCDHNILDRLDLSQNTELVNLYCEDCQLTNLDLSNNPNLELVVCSSNRFTSLDLSHNTELTNLWCEENQLSSLDVSNNLSLEKLICSPMPSLLTLYLTEGQTIDELIKPETTVIEYK